MTNPTLPTLDIEQIAREVGCTHVNLRGDRAMAIERLSRFAAEVARRSSMGAEPVGVIVMTPSYSTYVKWTSVTPPSGTKLYTSAPPSADAKDADITDTQRLDFITTFGMPWSVQWMKKGEKPVRYRMIDDGEPWGQWHQTARAAIDAAISASKEASK